MSKLKVREIFASIQGEGPFSGQPAIFVRLAGCNIQCPFCDTDHESEVKEWESHLLADHIFSIIKGSFPNINLVVITGGEPFLQNFEGVVAWLLLDKTIQVQVETNGTIDPEWYIDDLTIVVSPKPGHSVRIQKIDAFKLLVREGEFPFMPGQQHIIDTYLQPIDEKDPVQNKKNMDWAVKLCLETGYKLSLQLHKILSIQ